MTVREAPARGSKRRRLAFVVAAGVCALSASGYAWYALRQAQAATATSAPIAFVAGAAIPSPAASGPFMLFRSTSLGESHGHVGLVSLDAPGEQRRMSPLQ